ncbi:MAG: HAD family hydrolase [Anaerolineaceae bacterium]|nr:HAD family hydrolase [Anaerolineaceae bacterium]
MPLDIARVKALCFDVDGTIADTDDLWVNRLAKFLQPIRWLFQKQDVYSHARHLVMASNNPMNIVYEVLDRLHLDDEVFAFAQRFSKNHRGSLLTPIPMVKEMLITLQLHYPMAVVTARDERSTRSFLDMFELTPLFQSIVTGHTCEYTKPFPDPIIFAAKQLGVDPAECLMIGDTIVDIRSGCAAGAQTIGVLCGFGFEKDLSRNRADMILDNTSDLIQYLSIK